MSSVPNFFVYGEPDKPIDVGFLHVETVMERKQAHFGRVSAHRHERMAQITFWTSGAGSYFIEEERLDFSAPAVSFIPSGVVHGFTVDAERSDAIVVSLADGALPQIAALSILPTDRAFMARGPAAADLWESLDSIMRRLLRDYRAGLSAPLPALIAVAMNDIALLSSLSAEPAQTHDLARAFRVMVDRRFRDNWPIERYVAELGATPHLLTKAVRASFGKTCKDVIDERRLIEAKRLLRFTVRPVEDIAYETGFKDPAYFSRFFRQRTGRPPGEWRKGHGDEADQAR